MKSLSYGTKAVLYLAGAQEGGKRETQVYAFAFSKGLRASDHRIDEGFELGPILILQCLQSLLYWCLKSLSNGIFEEICWAMG